VVAVAERQHLVAAPGGGGQQQRRLVGLAARVGEEHLGVGDPRQLGHPLGQLDLPADQVQGRGVDHPARLLPDRLHHFGRVVADHRGQDPGEEVEVAGTLAVDHPAALAVDQLDRLVVVEGQPGRQHLAVAGEQFGVGHDPSAGTSVMC
jgi:hypothetical protein